MKRISDTISAVATPPGEGGIAVIRISGPDAIDIADRCFSGATLLHNCASHTVHFGEIVDPSGGVVDHVLCTLFHAPRSYTGEETVEVSCHGGSLVTRRVLETILGAGARHATPGEFTQRAFLNGRMDLSQAEAVADLIHAHSDAAHRASLQQFRGSVLRSVEVLRQQLLESCSMIELELDFSEDHYEFKDRSELDGQMRATIARVQELASTFRHGRVMREGVRTVIAGAPNVGKSSLLNALLNENRAIVTAIPGTTRDFIEESMNIRGIEFRLIDTAGIRETSDEVEREGVERSTSLIEHADIVLYLLDHSRPIFPTELEWIGKLHETHKEGEIILVINKKDLPSGLDAKGMALLNSLSRLRVISTSTHSGIGLDDLKTTMIQAAGIVEHVPGDSSVIVTNSRHHNALVRASTRLEMALGSLEENRSGEYISLDLRAALDHLGEIIGVVTTDDILNSIFSRFCIGK